jgi:hypothetical protein
MSAAGTREALLRRSVTMTDLERAARRFVADVDSVLGRCDDSAQSIIAALALITVGKHMDRRVLERRLVGRRTWAAFRAGGRPREGAPQHERRGHSVPKA